MPNATQLRLQRTGKRLIEKHGRTINFRRFDKSGDEVNPTFTAVDLPSITALQVGLTGKEDADLQARTKIVFLCHGLIADKPTEKMRIIDSADTSIDPEDDDAGYSIKKIMTVQLGEVTELYRVYGAV